MFEIQLEECADLLCSTALGRVAVTIGGHPEIFPVNHVFDPEWGCVTFASNSGTKLNAALASQLVAFEADGFSDDGRRGWSVLVVGHAEEILDTETIARLSTGRDRLWRTGESVRWLRIVATKMTGRRICNLDRAPTPPPPAGNQTPSHQMRSRRVAPLDHVAGSSSRACALKDVRSWIG